MENNLDQLEFVLFEGANHLVVEKDVRLWIGGRAVVINMVSRLLL